MEEQLYVIKRADHEGRYLRGLGIGCCNTIHPDRWTSYEPNAIRFNVEEAKATIEFITNVINWELGEQLYLEKAKEIMKPY